MKIYDEEYEKKIVKEEPFKIPSEAEIENIKNNLHSEEKDYSTSFILKTLKSKDSLRKVFLAVFKNNPSKISEILEFTGGYKQNTYPLLAQLVSYKILKRIYVSDILSGAENHEIVKIKFNKWTENMAKPTRQYYSFRTSYWEVTDIGKKYIQKAWEFEQINREKER